MKFLRYEIIPRAGFNLATGRFWPAGRVFDTPELEWSYDGYTCRYVLLIWEFFLPRSICID